MKDYLMLVVSFAVLINGISDVGRSYLIAKLQDKVKSQAESLRSLAERVDNLTDLNNWIIEFLQKK